MNRRDFIKMLAAVPALAWLKPEIPKAEAENYSPSLAYIKAYKRGFEGFAKGLEASGSDLLEATKPVVEAMAKQVRWNGTGYSWESVGPRATLEIQPDGILYIRGDFLEEDVP